MYASASRGRWGAAVALLVAGAIMNAALQLDGPARVAIELPLALVLPGAAVIAAARGSRPARPASDIGLAIVLSFATWIFVALVCFVFEQPLTTTAFVMGCNAVVLAAAVVCAVRAVPLSTLAGVPSGRDQRLRFVLFVLAFGACGATVAFGARVAPAPAPYSELALAGRWAHVASSVAVRPGKPVDVDIAVSNHTAATRTYVVTSKMQGATWKPRSFLLAPGATWRGQVSGLVPRGGCLHRLSVALGDPATESVVGTLTVWLQNGMQLPARCTP